MQQLVSDIIITHGHTSLAAVSRPSPRSVQRLAVCPCHFMTQAPPHPTLPPTIHAGAHQSLLQPGELHTFSAARYDGGNHIAPHDDRAYTQVGIVEDLVLGRGRRIWVCKSNDLGLRFKGGACALCVGTTAVLRAHVLAANACKKLNAHFS